MSDLSSYAPGGRRLRLVVTAVIVMAMIVAGNVVASVTAYAGVRSAQLTVVSDGTGPFDDLDSGPNNGLVRTHDNISYGWQYNTDATPSDVTFVQTITAPTAGVTFNPSNVGLCSGPAGGSISADGKTFTCQMSLPANATGAIPIAVSVDGSNPNGTPILTSLTADSIAAGSVSTSIVAAPKFDLRKNVYGFPSATQIDGVWGRLYFYTLGVAAPTSLKGSENIAGPVTFTDDVSGVSPNARLMSCSPVTTTYEGYELPFSAIGINGSATSTNSVVNSGNLGCAQPSGPGSPISINFTNPDWSASTVPSRTASGGVIASGTNWVATGILQLFIPVSDIEAAGGQLNTTNQYRGFDPLSISGQSNFGTGYEPGGAPNEPACPFVSDNSTRENNNCFSGTLVASQGSADKYLLTADSSAFLGGATGAHAGNGVITPGTSFVAQVNMANLGATPIAGHGVCDVWDPTRQHVVSEGEILRNASANQAQSAGTDYVVEYAALPLNSDEDRRNANCGSGTWYPTVAAAGGANVVNAIRIKANWTMIPNELDVYRVKFMAMPNVAGTIIGDWAMINYGNGWGFSTYNKETNQGSIGDRVTLTPAVASITKTTTPAVSSVRAGEGLTYQITPSLSSGAPEPAAVSGVVVKDVLSSCVQYVPGSASVPVAYSPGMNGADGVPCTGDSGETGGILEFKLGSRVPNQPIAPITYRVITSATTPDGTRAPNVAVVSFDGVQPTDIERRTAKYEVVIRNLAQFSIAKSTDTPVVQVRDAFRYTVAYRNNTGQAVRQVQMIDELPFNGDARGTSFAGAVSFAGASNIPSNAVVECTTAAHGTIDGDPAANTNSWSTTCPSNTTGVRITVTDVPDTGVGAVVLNFAATGNNKGDRYINTVAGARVSGLANPITETAPVRVDVVASSIGNRVWADANYNGIQDPSETGVGGVSTTLKGVEDNGTPVQKTTTTATDGSYLFSNLRAGSYTVSFAAPSGTEFTWQGAGTGSNDSRPPIGVGTQSAPVLALPVATDALNEDAGLAQPAIALVKSASAPSSGDTYKAGETVTYTFTATNTGPTPLSDVAIEEGAFTNGAGTALTLTTPIVASDPAPFDGRLVPGASAVFTATYKITQADVDAGGSISNSASVSGLSPARQIVTDDSSVQISTGSAAPGLTLIKGVANAPANGVGFVAGETITYTFTVRNTGNVTVKNVALSEKSFVNAGGRQLKLTTGPLAPAAFTGLLSPGEEAVFTGTYVVTGADSGGDLANCAAASALAAGGGEVASTSCAKAATDIHVLAKPSGLALTGGSFAGIIVVTVALMLLMMGLVLIVAHRQRSKVRN